MVHSGYEASGAYYTFASWKGFAETAMATLFSKYEDRGAIDLLNEPAKPVHGSLVQIAPGHASRQVEIEQETAV
jgi:hypothetical protein